MSLPAFTSLLLPFKLLGLYLFMAWPVPLSVKWACFNQTTAQVTQKFSQPLDFDTRSKNALREFWHYSYYRQCLYQHGYDTHGQIIPASTIQAGVYTNHQAGLSLTASSAAILTDNVLNVDYDDRLLLSNLIVNHQSLTLAVYTHHDDLKTPQNASIITHFPGLTAPIVSASPSSTTVYLTDADGTTGLLFFSPENLPRFLYGPGLSLDDYIPLLKLSQN